MIRFLTLYMFTSGLNKSDRSDFIPDEKKGLRGHSKKLEKEMCIKYMENI